MTQASEAGIKQADGSVKMETTIDVQHVASTLVHVASLPNTVQVLSFSIMYVLHRIPLATLTSF